MTIMRKTSCRAPAVRHILVNVIPAVLLGGLYAIPAPLGRLLAIIMA